MALPDFSMRQLLEAGAHFGHQTHRWNPKMDKYIFGSRSNIHIIDLSQSIPLLHQALVKVREVAAGDDVADRLQRAIEQRHRLLEVDDVDAVADAEQERRHLGIPAAGVVTKVHASFQQLAHREGWQSHCFSPFPVMPLRVE